MNAVTGEAVIHMTSSLFGIWNRNQDQEVQLDPLPVEFEFMFWSRGSHVDIASYVLSACFLVSFSIFWRALTSHDWFFLIGQGSAFVEFNDCPAD